MMAERSRAIKLGLIGCGRVAATCHLPALQNLAGTSKNHNECKEFCAWHQQT